MIGSNTVRRILPLLSHKSTREPLVMSPDLVLQLMEDLEQLKVLENGYKIKVIEVDHCAHGVDEPGDVDSIIMKMQELGLE